MIKKIRKSINKKLLCSICILIAVLGIANNIVYGVEISDVKGKTWLQVYEQYGAGRFGMCDRMDEKWGEKVEEIYQRAADMSMELGLMGEMLANDNYMKNLKDIISQKPDIDKTELKQYLACTHQYINNKAFELINNAREKMNTLYNNATTNNEKTKIQAYITKFDQIFVDSGQGNSLDGTRQVISIAYDELLELYNSEFSEEEKDQIKKDQDKVDEDLQESDKLSQDSSTSAHQKEEPTYSISGVIIKPTDKTDGTSGSTETPVDNPNNYNPGTVEVSSQLVNVGGVIVGALKYIGIIASVIMIMVIGIKYMIGSASEKAEYKKVMIPYIVGIILLSSGGFLIEILYKLVIGTGINN